MKKIVLILAFSLLAALACGRGEIKGTYDVELLIAGIAAPLSGKLILSTQPLDIPSLSEEDASIDSEWFGGDALSANSCFILAPRSTSESVGASDPGIVRVFEARIQPDGVATPIEILRASDLRIEVVKLQFFGNALGGELEIHVEDGIRPGRIRGARTGEASAHECVDQLAAFREFLRVLPSGEDAP